MNEKNGSIILTYVRVVSLHIAALACRRGLHTDLPAVEHSQSQNPTLDLAVNPMHTTEIITLLLKVFRFQKNF